MLVIVMHFIIRFLINYRKTMKNKCLFYFGILYCFIALIFFMAVIPYATLWFCFRSIEREYLEVKGAVDTAYFLQAYLLWLLLFVRIYFVFHDTSHKLNRFLVISFILLFIIGAFLLIGVSIIYTLITPWEKLWIYTGLSLIHISEPTRQP